MSFNLNKASFEKILEEKSWSLASDYFLLIPFLESIQDVNAKLTIHKESKSLMGFLLAGTFFGEKAPILFPEFDLSEKSYSLTNAFFDELTTNHQKLFFAKSHMVNLLLEKGANPWLDGKNDEMPEEVQEAILSDNVVLLEQLMGLPQAPSIETVLNMRIKARDGQEYKSAWDYLSRLNLNTKERYDENYANISQYNHNILKSLLEKGIYPNQNYEQDLKQHPFFNSSSKLLELLFNYDYFSNAKELLDEIENNWLSGNQKNYSEKEIEDVLNSIFKYKGEELESFAKDKMDIVKFLSFQDSKSIHMKNYFNVDEEFKFNMYDKINGLPGRWCSEGVFFYSMFKNNIECFSTFTIDQVDHEKFKSVRLGNGSFSLFTLCLIYKNENSRYKLNDEDVHEIFNFFSFLFEHELEKELDNDFFKKINLFMDKKINKNNQLRTNFIGKFHEIILCNQAHDIKNRISGVQFSNDLFSKYLAQQFSNLLLIHHKEKKSLHEVFQNAENLKEIYIAMIYKVNSTNDLNAKEFSRKLFGSENVTVNTIVEKFDNLPRQDILEELIRKVSLKEYPIFQSLKTRFELHDELQNKKTTGVKLNRF